MRYQGGAGDSLMPPILKKTQKCLPKFVTSHLSVTLLILEGVSFNVNQAAKERKDVSHRFYNRAHLMLTKQYGFIII